MIVEIIQSFDSAKLAILQEFIDVKLSRNATAIAFENGVHFFGNCKLALQDVASVLEYRNIKFELEMNKIKLLKSW